MNIIFLFFLFLFFTNCNPDFYSHINKQPIVWELPDDTSNLIRYDGIYNTYDTSLLFSGKKRNEEFVTDGEVIFFNNGRTVKMNNVTIDSIAFHINYYKGITSKILGIYLIKGDSIFVHTPIFLYHRGKTIKYHNVHFRGIIKNRDTILDWKMVPPYPDVDLRLNDYLKKYTTPKMLYFIKNDAIRCLDSISGQ